MNCMVLIEKIFSGRVEVMAMPMGELIIVDSGFQDIFKQ